MIGRRISAFGLALLVHAVGMATERPGDVRLVEVTSTSTATRQSVLITASEPASYTALQPDPLTVLITLRGVAAGDVVGRWRPAPDDPVRAVEVLDAVDDDGNPVAQVHIGLRAATVYDVRSRRQTIEVRFARPVVSTSPSGPADAAAAPPPVGRGRPATAILSVETAVTPHAISVTLHGNGALAVGRVYEAEHLPPRVILDFPHLAAEAAALTPVEIDPVKQVRVAPHSPELTRVVFDLARPAVYHIERVGENDRAVRLVFPRDHAIDPVAQLGGDPSSESVTGYRAATATTAPLLMPVSGDLPPRAVEWPEVRHLTGLVVALGPDAAPLRVPALSDLPPRAVEWPEVRHLTGLVVALGPDAAPLRVPALSDLPPRAVEWPEVRHLTGLVVALGPDAAPLRVPALSDLPPRAVEWPEVRHLTGLVVALGPDAAPLRVPALSDLPPHAVEWPELPRVAAATLVLDPARAPLTPPDPLDVPLLVDTADLGVTPLAVSVAASVEPVIVEAEVVVEPLPVEVAAAAVESVALVTSRTLVPSESVGTTEPERSIVAAPVDDQFVSLARAGRPTAPASRAAMQLTGQPAGAQQEFTGDPLSMDFQGADLRAVLRIFASDEVSGLNIVIDPSVQGEVNVALTDVPWDQAFDIILRANGLAYEVDGTVVRIASLQRLREEAEERALLSQREAEAGELVLFTRTLSYARADDLVQLITSTTLSPRGEVFTDPRTNTLIIRDLEDRLTAAGMLLDTLDRAEPQVEIEARIVQASHSSARALGVQWGVTGRVAQEIGNTLPFSFPNRGGLTGRVGSVDGQGPSGLDSRALPDENAATVVDLGIDAATTALGLTLGAVNGALNLDVVLSALESQGELRIISSPRVMTQNNVAAEILQGDQIPYQTVANNTVTVQFKEAALTLRVTPQITASQTVIMQVELENSFPDFGNTLGDPPIPPIVTQRAQTTVQVPDGATTVIGGIFENTQAQRNNTTPGLSRIPLLGWLFKSNDRSESTDELMIFLTPRIVQEVR